MFLVTNEESMSLEPIRVCKEHQVFSKGCTVCQLLHDRQNLVNTFWCVSKCCEGPYLGRPVATQLQPLKTILTTNEEAKAMKARLDHILEVASTMVDQYEVSGFKTLWDSLERQSLGRDQGAKGRHRRRGERKS